MSQQRELDRVEVVKRHLCCKNEGGSNMSSNPVAAKKSPLSTHILDTSLGKPAANVPVILYRHNGDGISWSVVNQGTTNDDGRCPNLITPEAFHSGVYKLFFDTATYFKETNRKGFYPYVEVVFEVEDPSQHYHVPLLLNPFGYSTYRGS